MSRLHRTRRVRLWLVKFGLVSAVGLALASCQELIAEREAEGAAGMEKLASPDSEAMEETLRAVAIPVGDDLFMIPAGLDEDDCEMFRPYAAGNPVKTAIHYRQADGSFDIARDPSICKVEMTPIGPDEDGCERYRAVPVNADLPIAVEVIYYKSADGAYVARNPEDRCG